MVVLVNQIVEGFDADFINDKLDHRLLQLQLKSA